MSDKGSFQVANLTSDTGTAVQTINNSSLINLLPATGTTIPFGASQTMIMDLRVSARLVSGSNTPDTQGIHRVYMFKTDGSGNLTIVDQSTIYYQYPSTGINLGTFSWLIVAGNLRLNVTGISGHVTKWYANAVYCVSN